MERLVQRQTSGALTVSTSPDFAAKWLVHRLGRFSEAHPDIEGLALARTTLASWDLLNGRLVTPLTAALKASRTYWIVCPKATAKLPKIEIFRSWLLSEVAADGRLLRRRR